MLSLRETVEKYGLMAQKALGQNFLLNPDITDKIIRLSLAKQGLRDFSGFNLAEVGPGPGGLTRSALSENPDSLTVIEMDERCVAIMEELRQTTGFPLRIINGDAMRFDIAANLPAPRQIISNLPYNISVPLLTGWLRQIKDFSALTLMFQKEVAERIMAPTRCKDYGRLSVLAQLTCRVDKLFDLSPECFTPAPKIWSSVLLFRPLEQIPDADTLLKVEKLTAAAFSQRRKMLRQSLKAYPKVLQNFAALQIAQTARAEELTPQQFLELAKFW